MDLPASYYGKVDKRNPVVIVFEREINSFMAVMKKVALSPPHEDNSGYVKGIKILTELWKKYKHRLPPNVYQEHMLQVADFLVELKFYDMALWYGYSLHLQQFTSVNIMDIEEVDHFKACFFPKGLDSDQDTLIMKIWALHGCALCIFERMKGHPVLTQDGLYKLLCVLDLIRIIMQVFQHYDSLCWLIYNGSALIYNICRYLMSRNYSEQALEYLLWASVSIELSVPLMTSKYVPWLVTLYCAVCQCYYDTHAAVQGEVFARRALVKIHELRNLEEQCGLPASIETTYKEASIKLAAMVFKRAAFVGRSKTFRLKPKRKLADIPNAPWPRNVTEQILSSLFQGGAAQFLGVLEALRDSSRHYQQPGGSDEPEVQEVVLELLAAGITLLSASENTCEQKTDHQAPASLCALTTSASLMDSAIAGENKICYESAVEFIKLLYHTKQTEAFTEYSQEMLQLLSCLEGQSFRKAQLELGLLYHYNSVQKERQKTILSISDEFIELVKTLHKSVCESDSTLQPNRHLVLSVILFVWDKIASVIERAQHHHSESKKIDKWVWCLSMLCEVAFDFEPFALYYCTMTGEMTLKLALLLESAAKRAEQWHSSEVSDAEGDSVTLRSFSLSKGSRIQLLQKVCAVVKRGLKALARGMSIMLPQDGSAVTDNAYMQKYRRSSSSPYFFEEGHSGDNSTIINTAKHTWTRDDILLAVDLHLYLNTIYFNALLGLQHLNAVTEFEFLGWTKKNKVSKAVFLMQKALMKYNMEPESTSDIQYQLEGANELIRKAGLEERKLYMSVVSTNHSASKVEGSGVKDKKDSPPPPPVLISRSDYSLCFMPAPYNSKEQVCWYQLMGHAAEGTNLKVRLGDCSLPGTGCLIPAESGRCVLKVEGLEPNQKYVFAVAAYNSQGDILGSSIGETTIPVLASPPLPLLTTWALLAQVAFQTKQYDVAKSACQKLWSHFTYSVPRDNIHQFQLTTPRLQVQTLGHSSLILRQSVFVSIFIETEINIQRGSLQCNSFSDRGLFIWEQIARLEECERMLVAMDLVSWLADRSDALQAVVVCYVLLTPLIYHQITCNPVIQVLSKCLKVLEENVLQLKQKWTGSTSESLIHRIACITYYLYKGLHKLDQQDKASTLMDSGIRLVQELFDAHTKLITKPRGTKKADAAVKNELKMSPQLKALLGKNKSNGFSRDPDRLTEKNTFVHSENLSTMTFTEDHSKIYDVVLSTPIRRAFQEVMKLRQKTVFIESSTLLLQRALEEGEAALVIEWGQTIFESLRKLVAALQHKTKSTAPVKKTQKQIMLRKMFCEESVWRTNLNCIIAQAHLVLFYQGLSQFHTGSLLHRYSQLDPLNFSMAYSGVSLRVKKNSQQQLPLKSENILERAHKLDDSEDICENEDGCPPHPEQHVEMQRQTAPSMLDSLNKATQHLRQAMVLAHRGGHWALLRSVCQTIWDQYCRTAIVQKSLQGELPFLITAEQQQNIFGPLLVLATDLIMDMLNQLGLWRAYENDLSEEETQSFLYFSVSLDETTKMDLHWVKTLVIHTLEQLHDNGKWEKLAHLALHFNTYTRDHYALIVSPLLINAQRKLLERIQSFRGPEVPQPHHVKTQKVSGDKVTYKSYAGIQLLSDCPPQVQEVPKHKKVSFTRDRTGLTGAEVQRSMALVCVPLDVEDTLYWYHKALEKRSQCLHFYQHSHSLLQLLLANSQPDYAAPFIRSKESTRSASMSIEFNPLVTSAPSVEPQDLMEEGYSTPEALYSLPLSPEHISTVIAAYTTSINYFHKNKCDSLIVVALHELGNLQYYNGNKNAAHSCWTKAVNCALKSPGALEKWDGATFGGCSLQQRLKLSGIWGCLQAACLTAKIAQYIFTKDISRRTNFCLQSAHLFKCVLCCSLAQPQSDLHYGSDIVIDELLPGIDLFSDPSRVHIGTIITSLGFICHHLFCSGCYLKLLPMLALYLHFVGPVCRNVHLTAQCKILKIRALTELGLFTEAVKEAVLLTKGVGICLPHGHYINKDKYYDKNTFLSTKSVIDNAGVLQELVNCDFTPWVQTLYGPKLCIWSDLARTQLILAISATISHPLQDIDPENRNVSKVSEQENADSKTKNPEQPKHPNFDFVQQQLTLGQLKYLLLEAVSTLLNVITKQLSAFSHLERLELTVESTLLKAKLNLLKGHVTLSSEISASSLMMLEPASEHTNAFISASDKEHFEQTVAGSEAKNQPSVNGDFVEMVEASERTGFSLWMRCRLTLVHSLTAHNPPDNRPSIKKAAQVIRDGIEECKKWGDPDSQALLMLEGAQWDFKSKRKNDDDKSALLKQIVSLLLGRQNMPPHSAITLAQATMLLKDMKTEESVGLLRLSQKLLQNQLSYFTENILDDGELCLPCSSTICLPFLHLLHHTTSCIGQILGS